MDRYLSRLTVHVYAICQKLNSLVLLRPHSQACRMYTGAHKVFKMAQPCVGQTASRESLQDWLVRLNIDLATFSDMLG